jgi:hypothetical protein
MRGHFLLNFYAAVYRLINYIRRLSEVGGDDLETTFACYRFLASYFAEMQRYMPEGLHGEAALQWWQTEINAWEKLRTADLPLLGLCESAGIGFHSRVAWMIVGLLEEDSRFGTIFARLQEPLTYRRPCLELVGQMMLDGSLVGHADSWTICRPLLSTGLIDVTNRDAPRSEWLLRVPSILWDAARGEVESHPAPWCQYHTPGSFPPAKALIASEKFLSRLDQVPALVMGGKAGAIVLRGTPGSERLQMLGAVARALGRGVIEVNGPTPLAERQWELLGPLCSMTRSLPALTYDLGPGETAELAPLAGYNGPIGILMDLEGGVRGKAVDKAVTLTIPAPGIDHRRRYWQEALAGYPVADLAEISERFHIPGGYIRQASAMAIAQAALDRREAITVGDVREACRALNRQLLDTLATRLEVEGSWDHLVVGRGHGG